MNTHQKLALAILAFLWIGPTAAQCEVSDLSDAMRGSTLSLEFTGQDKNGHGVTALGSGVIVDRTGYALTAAHIIEDLVRNGAVEATITIKAYIADLTSSPIDAKLVDKGSHDIALIKLDYRHTGYSFSRVQCNTGFDLSELSMESTGFPFSCTSFDTKTQSCHKGHPAFLHLYGRSGQSGDSQTPDTLDVLMRFDYGASGSPVFLPNALLVGVARGNVASSETRGVFIPLSYADALIREVPGIPACIDLSACLNRQVSKTETFNVSGGARAAGPGISAHAVSDNRTICYQAPPGFNVIGQATVTDNGNNGGRGSIGPVQYITDQSGNTSKVCVAVQASSESKPFGGGGWQNITLSGSIKAFNIGPSEVAKVKAACINSALQ